MARDRDLDRDPDLDRDGDGDGAFGRLRGTGGGVAGDAPSKPSGAEAPEMAAILRSVRRVLNDDPSSLTDARAVPQRDAGLVAAADLVNVRSSARTLLDRLKARENSDRLNGSADDRQFQSGQEIGAPISQASSTGAAGSTGSTGSVRDRVSLRNLAAKAPQTASRLADDHRTPILPADEASSDAVEASETATETVSDEPVLRLTDPIGKPAVTESKSKPDSEAQYEVGQLEDVSLGEAVHPSQVRSDAQQAIADQVTAAMKVSDSKTVEAYLMSDAGQELLRSIVRTELVAIFHDQSNS